MGAFALLRLLQMLVWILHSSPRRSFPVAAVAAKAMVPLPPGLCWDRAVTEFCARTATLQPAL